MSEFTFVKAEIPTDARSSRAIPNPFVDVVKELIELAQKGTSEARAVEINGGQDSQLARRCKRQLSVAFREQGHGARIKLAEKETKKGSNVTTTTLVTFWAGPKLKRANGSES